MNSKAEYGEQLVNLESGVVTFIGIKWKHSMQSP